MFDWKSIISILQFWIADLFAYKENVDDLLYVGWRTRNYFFVA